MAMDKLLTYLNSISKGDRAIFCKACATTEGYLRKAVSTRQPLRVALCVLIEHMSGTAVTRKDLRPDDWAANWPELAVLPEANPTDTSTTTESAT
jgi:DNA-binding transcriptional regulator YdaS (Cro superfamily)